MNLALEIDFNHYLAGGDRFVAALRDSSEGVLRAVAGAAVVEMAAKTPPGSWRVQGISALRLGEQMVKADAHAVVRPVAAAVDPEPVERIIRRHRGRDGRVVKPQKRIVVSGSGLARYLRKELPRVGYTAGGFSAAASALGRTLPSWMVDVPGEGGVEFDLSPDAITITIRNNVAWFATMDGVQARMDRVLADYGDPLRDRLEAALRASLARAGMA